MGLATGQPLKDGDDVDPVAFEGKIFVADVGYRSNGSNGAFSYRNLNVDKKDGDFLRVHELREKIEEKGLTHMGSYGAINMLHIHEHEHDTRAFTLAPTPPPAVSKSSASAEAVTAENKLRMVRSMSDEQRSQGHARRGAALAQDSAPGPAPSSRGITAIDVLKTFPGAWIQDEN